MCSGKMYNRTPTVKLLTRKWQAIEQREWKTEEKNGQKSVHGWKTSDAVGRGNEDRPSVVSVVTSKNSKQVYKGTGGEVSVFA